MATTRVVGNDVLQILVTEVPINQYVTGNQSDPFVFGLKNGTYVIGWTSDGQDGSQTGVYARILSSGGALISNEFRVNEFTGSYQGYPRFADLGEGKFLAVFGTYHNDPVGGIAARIFLYDGTPAGNEFKINTHTNSNQSWSEVAALNGGGFVATWESYFQDGSELGIYAQRFNKDGSKNGAEFLVNNRTLGDQARPNVAGLDDGGFVITWATDNGTGKGSYNVKARRYNSAGNVLADEYNVNNQTVGSGNNVPIVRSNGTGGWIVLWTDSSKGKAGPRIFGRIFDAAGNALHEEFVVAEWVLGTVSAASLTVMPSGNFVATWNSDGQDSSGLGVYAREFNSRGVPVSREYLVNTSIAGNQSAPSVAAGINGDVMYTWQSDNADGSGYGIIASPINRHSAICDITFSGNPKEGAGEFTTSINLTAGTQTTGNLAEGAQVWWKVTGISADDLVSGALTGTGTITNGKLDILHSLKADADTGENFEVSVYSDEDRTQQVGTTTSAAVLEGPVVRGNSLYTIVDGPSWTQAEANSVKLGGHLASIGGREENALVLRLIDEAYKQTAWIGFTDKSGGADGRQWKWIDGMPVTYENWNLNRTHAPNSPEPNDAGSIQTYAEMYGTAYEPLQEGSQDAGAWNDLLDVDVSNGRGKGVAETPFIRRGDSAYVIVQGPTWEEAEANAVKLGGHLVTINDAAEWSWFKSQFSPANGYAYPESYNYYPNGEVQLWVGVNDTDSEGQYKWVSSESSSVAQSDLLSLGGGTPAVDDYGVWQWEQAKIAFYTKQLPAEWIGFAKNIRGVAEIKLAPNSTPTGTPTLSGTLKAGQVITIDRTPIQDADNFPGYTPGSNYFFEVSGDNGTTWNKLSSADATDNNTTYTLTTAEVGKKIRGVVSYLDGYGTNESVASDASSNVIAPSNTAPTALQTLRGSSKVGRVLTADKSTIVDPDGVPSAVSYGWEVSSNGTNWTKLTSADATDNNSTYALTAAELGKTVRSVISYTDGFGTNETVSSAPTSVVLAGAKPTGISLSKSTFAENVGPNAAVVKLNSVDLDIDDAYTYSLVSGSGSTDNSRFSIAGDQLVITGNPDFETKNSYSIRVRTTDLAGLSVDKSFTLKVTNVTEAPDSIYLSDTDFQENIAAGSVIASLTSRDPDRDTAFTYSLTPNSPRATFVDNQFFSIVNDQLKINAAANFEQKDSYTISVRSTDAGKLFYDQVFTLVVQDIDEAPTDISITGTGIDEGASVGSIVGSLVSTDQDESSTDFTYEFVAGNKPNNNDQFEIVGDQLKAKATFNFETKSSYVVNVRTTDEAGLTFNKSITIKVNNVNENPTDLTVSATAFNENVALGTTVSTLGVLDPDKGDTYSYSFVSGEGDKDNQAFLIAGNALKVNVATNFEVQKSYSVRLRVTDQGGLFFDKAVSLGVNNQVEKVTSGVSTTLAPDKDTLELTGTKNIFGMGNQFDNTITGNSGKNKLIGRMGKDILTGGTGTDTFFYNDLNESLLASYDVITDYASGEKISTGFVFEGDDLIASTGKASASNEGAIGSVLSNTTFLANNAAAFTVEGLRGTFLALNDGRDGFQADSDALIHLSNYTIGSKTPISII